jgi:hypothetical protein
MFVLEVYAAVRQFVFNDGKSRREAARVFGLSRETVSKMCRFSMSPGYVRQRPAVKPKLGPLIPVIEAILKAYRTAPVKHPVESSPGRLARGFFGYQRGRGIYEIRGSEPAVGAWAWSHPGESPGFPGENLFDIVPEA